jgi:hypothetical protein
MTRPHPARSIHASRGLVDGVEVPRFSACRGPGNTFLDRTPELTDIMEAVAEHWEGIIQDDHGVDIAYALLAPELGAPNRTGMTASGKAAIHGDIKSAVAYHGFPSVKAFMDALGTFCKP